MTTAAVPHEAMERLLSPEACMDKGRALRDQVSRDLLGHWKADRQRANPITLLRASDEDRVPELIPIRYGRMLASPFAFYRGAAGIMASDLAHAFTTGLQVQACGDCHLANFGGFATPERHIIFDLNDFDETLPAPWDWDVRRLVASFALASRANGLSDRHARDAAVICARSYREHLRKYAALDPFGIWYEQIRAEDIVADSSRRVRRQVERRIAEETAGSGSELVFPQLADVVGGQVHIADQPPLIYHPEVARDPQFLATIEQLILAYRDTLADDRRELLDRYRVVDAAMKVVGIGSVGRRCWIALLMSAGNTPLFLQFKEAVASVMEPFAGKSRYRHHGERVVMGQRLMQPASDIFLGWLTGLQGRHFYVRQLRDGKIKPAIEAFDAELMEAYAGACGHVLARAHAKGSAHAATISGYLGASNDEFDIAMGNFAIAYADQAERDHAALKAAVRTGKIRVHQED